MTVNDDRHHRVVSTREVGVSCVPMCRDVGVTTPTTTASVTASTMTDERPPGKPETVTAYTQTLADVKPATVPAYTQTNLTAALIPAMTAATTVDVGTQTTRPTATRTSTVGVMAKPRMYDASVAAKPSCKHVGCTANTIEAVKPATVLTPQPVTRTTQTDAGVTAALQTRTTQTDATGGWGDDDRHHRTTQTEAPCRNVRPDGGGGRPVTAIGRRSNSFHHYTAAAAVTKAPSQTKDPSQTTSAAAVASKIPRLKQPVTPESNRKVLNRQDTYTKEVAEIGYRDQPSAAPSPQPPTPLLPSRGTDDDDSSFDDVK